ncbi:chemotaxis protein CheA [Parasedimentitalea huanghaiensis]|uniref:Chemotaxis protein CheA n=1 Tax=Parasedimentitalea huanghaiensis TaxID=2682100 RepID=A0A6L6WJ96_9RHOB|nr:chemotaxis protein CheA [Zongyanglinia huanghaiensis]MVO16117.1 chemotaxis protein CheA [Zongyanglinia huanghaiensis]
MVQNNKVLTVSYGTFSCTLEGFEDSFDTMKAIAEYFRDLASDDRYFGAEPPQPDAEMLTRIAQREVSRQVEARTSDGAIHLRAAESTEPAKPAAAPVAPAVEPAEPAPQAAEAPEKPARSTAEVPTPKAAAEVAIEEAPAEDFVVTKSETETAVEEPVDLTAVAAAPATPEAASLPTAEDLVADEPAGEQPDASEDSSPAADSIAAKLQRIRAVVAQAPRDEEFSEDQHAENFIQESAVDIAAAMRLDDEAELAADEASQDQVEIAQALDLIDQRQADNSESQPKAEVETKVEAATKPAPDLESPAEPEVSEEIEQAAVIKTDPEPEVDHAAATTSATEAEADVEEDNSLFEGVEKQDSTSDSQSEDANILAEVSKQVEPAETAAEAPATKRPRRARIVRVKRAVIDDAVKSGALEEVAEEPVQPAPETSLSDADEAELLQELAAVEAELLANDDTPEPIDETKQEVAEDPAPAPAPSPVAETPDSDVSRLMDAADEKLEDPELSSSRETYDHLRAAMAAALADRAAGGSTGVTNSDEDYRNDLASVVRPRRPTAAKGSAPRPTPAQRPAPLKLVAEQRIDEAPEKSNGPVRPRRVASAQADDAAFADKGLEGGFAAYALESGAVELYELLEAAASYMSFVEGREHFSRPQLMNKVKLLDSAEFNREDGLRSFGQLLREGKIEKTNSGHFTASGQIGFRPDERVAG